MNYGQDTAVILAALSTTLALADDFKTINGKEYKNVTVSRVEADGIVLKSKSGISKVYFVELPKEVQQRFHYNLESVADISSAPQPPSQNRELVRLEIARGLREMYSALRYNDTQILKLDAHTNEVIARNGNANSDAYSDAFMIGARLGQLWDISLLLEFIENTEPSLKMESGVVSKHSTFQMCVLAPCPFRRTFESGEPAG